MIVRPGEGCYEYHMNHQESADSKDDALRPALEVRYSVYLMLIFAMYDFRSKYKRPPPFNIALKKITCSLKKITPFKFEIKFEGIKKHEKISRF